MRDAGLPTERVLLKTVFSEESTGAFDSKMAK